MSNFYPEPNVIKIFFMPKSNNYVAVINTTINSHLKEFQIPET